MNDPDVYLATRQRFICASLLQLGIPETKHKGVIALIEFEVTSAVDEMLKYLIEKGTKQ